MLEATENAIEARDLALTTKQGPVFSNVNLDVAAGDIHALVGPQGSGRSSLLLVLAGRMRFSAGELSVYGHSFKPGRFSGLFGGLRPIQKTSAIAGFHGIDDLDISTGVGEIVNERLGLITPPLRHAETWYAERVEEIREMTIPHVQPNTWVRNLTAFDDFATRIALALLDDPQMLLVDNVDQLTAPEDQRRAWTMLRGIQEYGVTVVASTTNTETMPDDIPRTATVRHDEHESLNHDEAAEVAAKAKAHVKAVEKEKTTDEEEQ